jgi:hypothetical protein
MVLTGIPCSSQWYSSGAVPQHPSLHNSFKVPKYFSLMSGRSEHVIRILSFPWHNQH